MEEKKSTSLEPKPLKKEGLSRTGIVFFIVLGVILAFLSVFAIGLYGFSWEDNFTYKVSQIVPYPAALVNYNFLRYSDYRKDVETLNHYYQKMNSVETGSPMPSEEDLEQISLNRMIRNEFTKQLSKDYNLKITNLELDQEMEKIVSQSESSESVDEILKDLYNWTREDLKEQVLYYYLLRAKLQEALLADMDLAENIAAKKTAEEVLNKLKNEEDTFENLAKEYGQDSTASQGGTLGFFKKGEMVAEFEQAAFALEVGQISDLVKSPYGYHIIKVLDRKGEGDDLEVEASHILIKTVDLDEYIEKKIKEARVYIFVKGIKWDKDSALVTLPLLENEDTSL